MVVALYLDVCHVRTPFSRRSPTLSRLSFRSSPMQFSTNSTRIEAVPCMGPCRVRLLSLHQIVFILNRQSFFLSVSFTAQCALALFEIL
jgi:hypothetical protein